MIHSSHVVKKFIPSIQICINCRATDKTGDLNHPCFKKDQSKLDELWESWKIQYFEALKKSNESIDSDFEFEKLFKILDSYIDNIQ